MTFDEHQDRVCAECAHLVGRRTLSETADKWKCHAKQNLLEAHKDLVTGEMVYKLRFLLCYSARMAHYPSEAEVGKEQYDKNLIECATSSCGPLGLWFEPYTQPEYKHQRIQPYVHKPETTSSVDDLLKELE